jgi:hypothetical protein
MKSCLLDYRCGQSICVNIMGKWVNDSTYHAAYVFVDKGCLLIYVIKLYLKNFISVSEIDFCVTDICENIFFFFFLVMC